jgi:glycosyltransferase involved in cell wall biosynthesis
MTRPLRAVHIASGDRWAGAEVQLCTLLTQLRLRDDIEPHAILMNEGELAERLRAAGVPVDILDESRLGALDILCGLCALLRRHRPDVVHTHRIKENILGALANRLTVNAAGVRTVHGADEHVPQGLRQLPKRILRTIDHWIGNHWQQRIIAVSIPLAEQLATKFPRDRIVVIENGVDIDGIRTAAKPAGLRESAPDGAHIGLVGRLDPVKRIDIFLRMALQLRQHEPMRPWAFHIFGEGSLQQPLQQLTRDLGIDDIVCFHGHRLDMPSCLAELDLLVICSDHEGMPMTLLEALALGTPVVAHAVGGMSCVLTGQLAAQLVYEHTPAGYARAVRATLATDRQTLSNAARARIESGYSASGNASAVQHLYRQLVAARQP